MNISKILLKIMTSFLRRKAVSRRKIKPGAEKGTNTLRRVKF
jgi:hypothetical protein